MLDATVLSAYGFSAKKDLLAQLLALNLEVAGNIERREPVTPPGIPANFPKPGTLVSDDCILMSTAPYSDWALHWPRVVCSKGRKSPNQQTG